MQPHSPPGDRPRIVTNMAFWQSAVWTSQTDTIYDLAPWREHQGRRRPAWLEAWQLVRRARDYDAVVTEGARPSLWYGLFSLLLHRPSKQIMSEVFIDAARPTSPSWRLKTALYRSVAGRALGVLTNSSAELETIGRRFAMPAGRLRYVPMHTNIAEPHLCTENDGFVLSAGRTQRDYAALLQVAPQINAPIVILCGRKDLLGEAAPANVRIFRDLPTEEYLDHVRRCAVMVLPLLPTERSTGQVVMLEAMALGKPVVATRSPGTADHISDRENGRLVPPGDSAALAAAVNDLLASPAAARTLAERALKDVLERNTFDQHATRKLATISELWREARLSRGSPATT